MRPRLPRPTAAPSLQVPRSEGQGRHGRYAPDCCRRWDRSTPPPPTRSMCSAVLSVSVSSLSITSSFYMLTLRGPCYADPWSTMICYILIAFCCIRSAIQCTHMQFFVVLVVLQGRPWHQWLEIWEWLSIDRGKVPAALFGFRVHSYLILLLDCSFSSSLCLHWIRWISRWVTAFLFDFPIQIDALML
jgi:hypothetical protein